MKNTYNKNKKLLNSDDKINYINIYHKKWDNNQNILLLKSFIDDKIKCKNIIAFGFISAPYKCKKQKFHIDYGGSTNTYFIPLIDLERCVF